MFEAHQSLVWSGYLDAQPVSMVHAQVARAGSAQYLLLGLDDGSILDISEIEPDDRRHTLTLINAEGLRHTAHITAAIRTVGVRCHLKIPPTRLRASDPEAPPILLKGNVEWNQPAAVRANMDGTLQMRSADRTLPPTIATWTPFSEGWQLNGLIKVQRGLTLSVVLFTDPPALHLIETRIRKDQPSVRKADVRDLRLNVVEAEHHTVVRFQAEVDDGLTGFQPLSGHFLATRNP